MSVHGAKLEVQCPYMEIKQGTASVHGAKLEVQCP